MQETETIIERASITPEQLVKDYEDFKISKSSDPARASATRISDIGMPCTAYIAFTRIAGEQRGKPDATLACIFDEGHKQEQAVMVDLREMGYACTEDQRTIYWDAFELCGHPDCKLSKNGWTMPLEIKSVSPFGFAKMKTEEDIRNHKSYYYAKWIAQIQLYMLLESREEYWLVLKNKATGQIRIIPIQLDLEYAEQFLKKAEEVKDGVRAHNNLPRPGDSPGLLYWADWLKSHRLNDAETCLECPFRAICLPDLDAGPGAYMADDPELPTKLDRREELKPLAAEFEQLDGEIKDQAKAVFDNGHREIICGHWVLRGKAQAKTNYNFPDEVKQKYAVKGTSWRTIIARIE